MGASNANDVQYPTHSFLQFGPWGTEAPFRVEMVQDYSHSPSGPGVIVVRGTDLNWGEHNQQVSSIGHNGAHRTIYEFVDRTHLTNHQIIDPLTGKGIVHDVWLASQRALHRLPGHFMTDMFRDCNSFTKRLVQHSSLFGAHTRLSPELDWLVARGEDWNEERPDRVSDFITVKAIFHVTEPYSLSVRGVRAHRVVFTLPTTILNTPNTDPFRSVDEPVFASFSYTDEWEEIPRLLRKTLDIFPLPEFASAGRQMPKIFARIERCEAEETATALPDDSDTSSEGEGWASDEAEEVPLERLNRTTGRSPNLRRRQAATGGC